MLELLSPAGSPQAVVAAVQSGADAIYLGYGNFNARRNAKNFTQEEVTQAVEYCHVRGSRVFLTLNTLLTDRELPDAAQVGDEINKMGVDAVIIHDLGVLRMLGQVAPQLPLHGSTQMTIHSLDGVKQAADLGLERVVLSRELSEKQLDYICMHAPIEVEAFVHGALCMSYSGQCYFSAMLGGRSGNRGLCAQPCRLKYGLDRRPDGYPLSLKDMSLAGYLTKLDRMGIACLKIEGRMKRPEYVAIVTAIYARALRERREPTQAEREQLEAAFSRQGFTQGYFLDRQGPDMFGTRKETEPPRDLYAQARATYENGEEKKSPIRFYAKISKDAPAQIAVQDKDGNTLTLSGPVPQTAIHQPLTAEKVESQLSRTGGTPYLCEKIVVKIDPDLSLPLSALNGIRRDALDQLTELRKKHPSRTVGCFHPGVRYENQKKPPLLTLSVTKVSQISPELLAEKPDLIYLPAQEGSQHPEVIAKVQEAGVPLCVLLPRIATDDQNALLEQQLDLFKTWGVTRALAGTLDGVYKASQLGFSVGGDFGIGVYNSQTLKTLKRMGLIAATASFELKLAQIRDLSKCLPLELIVYGYLPLMITENCIISNGTHDGANQGTSQRGVDQIPSKKIQKNKAPCDKLHSGPCHAGQTHCQEKHVLVDRKGISFPVIQSHGCRSEILNAKRLFLADKSADWHSIGIWGGRLMFTTESSDECVKILKRYRGQGHYMPSDHTRGLYYRGVE